ncbi:MAG: hypothetical protein AAF938_00680, partial [Myxococcota bacterium]
MGVERLERHAAGHEQTWTFAREPAGEGQLEVRVAAPDELVALNEHGALIRRGSVMHHYGAGTWIDAAGNETAIPLHFEDEALVLRVPDHVISQSVYPAVLDPIIGELNLALRFAAEPTTDSVRLDGTDGL